MANNNSLNNTSYGFTLPSLNLNFTSTAQRITGDMSNTPHVNRLSFQTNVVDGATSPFIIPNGTSVTSSIICANASNPTNSAFAQMQIDNASVKLVSSVLGLGVQLPIEIRIGATAAININNNLAVSILNTLAGNIALTVNATATGGVEVQQNTAANAGMRIYTSLGNINGPRFEMLKSRSGGNVIPTDNLGQFIAYGFQTAGYQSAAQIIFKAESVAASRVSGAIQFLTTSTASVSAVRLNISADGAVTIPATVAGNVPLTITGTNSGGLTVSQSNSGAANISLFQSSATAEPPYVNFFKSMSGGNVSAADGLGNIRFFGFATANQVAAQITCIAESIGATRVSGGLNFWTTNTAGSTGQRLVLVADGGLSINAPSTAISALGVNGFATAGTYAQQNNAYVTSGLFSAFRALNVDGTAGGSCEIEVSVFNQLAGTGGDATLLFGNYGGTNIKIGNDVSVNQFSMSTGNLGDGNTFLSYDVLTSQINLPRQCAWSYYAAQQLNVTGGAIGNAYTVRFANLNYNIATTVNGIFSEFTVPKTGKYLLSANVRIDNLIAGMTTGYLSILSGATTIAQFALCNPFACSGAGAYMFGGSTMVALNTGSVLSVVITVIGLGTNDADILASISTNFSGQLLS
jgi:hypothetical protein